MKTKIPDGFHVVRCHFNDKPMGYEVYCCNEPFLKGSGQPLRLREARWIAETLNARTGMRWSDKSGIAA